MLGRVFSGENGGRVASGVAACVASAAWKKKFIFFLSSFPERMFREVNGTTFVLVHAARDRTKQSKNNEKIKIK
jgi:hypothetical protein